MTVDMVNLSNKPLCSWRVGIPLFYLHGHANQWLGRVRTRNRNQMHFDLKKPNAVDDVVMVTSAEAKRKAGVCNHVWAHVEYIAHQVE